jgi:hypothetical protein
MRAYSRYVLLLQWNATAVYNRNIYLWPIKKFSWYSHQYRKHFIYKSSGIIINIVQYQWINVWLHCIMYTAYQLWWIFWSAGIQNNIRIGMWVLYETLEKSIKKISNSLDNWLVIPIIDINDFIYISMTTIWYGNQLKHISMEMGWFEVKLLCFPPGLHSNSLYRVSRLNHLRCNHTFLRNIHIFVYVIVVCWYQAGKMLTQYSKINSNNVLQYCSAINMGVKSSSQG